MPFNEQKATEQLEHDIAADAAAARRRVRREAEKGRRAFDVFPEAIITQIFDGHADELNDAIATANRVRAERDEREQRAERNAALRTETARVLREWDKAEADKRKAKAEVEAKRRLADR